MIHRLKRELALLSWTSERLTRVGLAVLVAYFLVVGFIGLDFGNHPDEWYHVGAVAHCIDTLTWLPQAYNYNGIHTLVGLPFVLWKTIGILPRALGAIDWNDLEHLRPLSENPRVIDAQRVLGEYVHSKTYLLQVRGLCLVVSSLIIPWTYCAALAMFPEDRRAGLLASAFVTLSWEFGYHARFIAVDAILTQFLALELWMFLRSWNAGSSAVRRRWAVRASAAAACALACKSTAVFAVLPLIALAARSAKQPRRRLRTAATMAAVYALVMFVLSPGVFVDPVRFLDAMARERINYSEIAFPSFPYFTRDLTDHASRAMTWLFMVVPSPFHAAAGVLSSFVALGIVDRLRKDAAVRVWTVYVVSFFIFIAHYHLLCVRHHLVALPWLAILFAAGVRRSLSGLAVVPRRVVAASLGVCFALNAAWVARTAAGILRATPSSVLADFAAHVARARAPFWISPALAGSLGAELAERERCVPADRAQPPRNVYFFYDPKLFWKGHVNNRVDGLAALFGPLAANYDWNVTFLGKMVDDKGIAGVSWPRAKRMDLKMDDYLACPARP